MKNNKNIVIIILIVILVSIIILFTIRLNTQSSKSLECVKDYNNTYEKLLFRYDINSKLYNYEKDYKLYNLTEDEVNNNYSTYNQEYERLKEELNDNFKYEVKKSNDSITVKSYILVSIYGNLFNQLIRDEHINSNSKIEDVKSYLESNEYKCEIRKI